MTTTYGTSRHRISVDFNTLTSEPLDIVKIAADNPTLPPLTEGERVTLYDEELEVEAILRYDAPSDLWLATPDEATWHEIATTSTGTTSSST